MAGYDSKVIGNILSSCTSAYLGSCGMVLRIVTY